MMRGRPAVLAVVFDFDEALLPDSTSKLLQSRGVDPLEKERGISFGVFDPARKESARKAFTEFLQTDRVISMHAPKYGPGDELGSLLRIAVATRASAIMLQRAQAESLL